jgi:hypothetical protein
MMPISETGKEHLYYVEIPNLTSELPIFAPTQACALGH